VITETLRLYSPVWILPRRAIVDVELDGHLLRAGSRTFFSPYALNLDAALHRDPDLHPVVSSTLVPSELPIIVTRRG
jgi:cytochrome P450